LNEELPAVSLPSNGRNFYCGISLIQWRIYAKWRL